MALESAASFLNPKQVVAMITNGLEKLGSIYVSAPRRKRSCPGKFANPSASGPEKSATVLGPGEITHEIIPIKA
jgi:hypothetical protein